MVNNQECFSFSLIATRRSVFWFFSLLWAEMITIVKKLQCPWQVQKSYLVKAFYVNSRLSGSRWKAVFSFFFLQPAGLVFDRAVAAFLFFDFHSLEKTIDPNANMARKLQCKVVREYSRERNWTEIILTKRGLAQTPEKYLRAEFVYEASQGSFSTSIFT